MSHVTDTGEIYPRPAAMVDMAIFTIIDDALKVLLVKRAIEPFQGKWALPGGHINVDPDSDNFDKTIEDAARRELLEETNVKAQYLEQVKTYGSANRDPRGWTLSVAYFALIPGEAAKLIAGTDASEAMWHTVHDLKVTPPLAFDHKTILMDAIARLRAKVEYTTIAVHLLPKSFTLSELQHVYEILLQSRIDKSSFRRRIKESHIVKPVNDEHRGGANRPAQLYQFVTAKAGELFFPRSIALYAKGG